MLKPVFKDGVPTCPKCGSPEFNVGLKETLYHELDASKGNEGWDIIVPDDIFARDITIEGFTCLACAEDLKITPEVVEFIQKIMWTGELCHSNQPIYAHSRGTIKVRRGSE